ncbi:MAG: DUF853 family protein [Desulfuromonadaceae bacterium]|nr:DUF853 family protein [Desulfuromonadaceae bacterium]
METHAGGLPIARGKTVLNLIPRMANRHGLIAGATGTGKTVTLKVLAENFSAAGVPVFLADVKGDLSGLCDPGGNHAKIAQRASDLNLEGFTYRGFPVVFWDLFAVKGHPVRATISDVGPLLMGRLLNLNETQSGVLSMVFRIADDNGLLLLDLKDLRAMLQHVGENASQFRNAYGNVSSASIGAIQRGLLRLEEEGADRFFGEPALDLDDFMRTDPEGRGVINILAADRLMSSPNLYSTCLLWMLAELFEQLPEVGDPLKPKLVFFFDEAHLLFKDVSRALQDKIEQVVRLIRSKGVGIYFVTQNPLDLPDAVLGQLGNRVQHALRAFTPRDQKAVRAAAQTFRANPGLDVEKAIGELGVGEALVSFLDDKGIPAMVERALIYPPVSRMSPLEDRERDTIVRSSPLYRRYQESIDRDSAYERLSRRAEQAPAPAEPPPSRAGRRGSQVGMFEALAKSAAHAIGSQVGRQLIRGILGSMLGKKR